MTGGLASTTVTVALPDIMGAFGIGRDQAQMMTTGYFASQTAGMLLSAWLVRSFGERFACTVVLLVFLLGSGMSGLAHDPTSLMVGRVLAGMAAGVLQPLGMAVVFLVFPAGQKGLSMGVFAMGMIMAPAFGPTVGGLAIDAFSWRYIFLIAMPTAFIALVLAQLFLPSKEFPKKIPRFDFLSFFLLCASLFGLFLGFSSGQRLGWTSTYILSLFAFGLATGIAFVHRQLTMEAPLVNFQLFANVQFTASALVGFCTECAFLSSTLMLPLFVQQIQHFTPLHAGLLMMPAGLSLIVLFPICGRLADFLPPQMLIYSGLLCYAVAFYLMGHADVNTPFWTLVGFTLIMRLGSAFTRPVTNSTALSSIPADLVQQGSSSLNFTRKLGGALGANIVIVFLEQRIPFYGDAFATTQTGTNQTGLEMQGQLERLLSEAGVPEAARSPGALDYLGDVIVAQANTLGFQDTFIILAGLAFSAIIPAYILSHTMKRQRMLAPAE